MVNLKNNKYMDSKKNKNKVKKKGFFRRIFKKRTIKKGIKVKSKKGVSVRSILYNPIISIISKIPRNSFGVFVTVHRELDKLKSHPYDVHGCIGHWDHEYNNESPEIIYDNIMDVSLKATFEDDRKNNFPPLENDVFSTIEINYLLTPMNKNQ